MSAGLNRLRAMRAALAVGLVVRFSQLELDEVVAAARDEGLMPPVGSAHPGEEIMRAFGLEGLGMKYEHGAAMWLLIPHGARPPAGELGGGATIVSSRFGTAALPLFEPVGVFDRSALDLVKEADPEQAEGTF